MEIKKITSGKKRFLSLLLLADEQENMIHRYLDRGEMYVLYDPEPVSLCVVTDEGGGNYELKNLATDPKFQGRGYATHLIDYLCRIYGGNGRMLYVGTGDSPLTLPFYEKRGFVFSHRVADFFTRFYDHPIIEAGVLLKDMIYLKKELSERNMAMTMKEKMKNGEIYLPNDEEIFQEQLNCLEILYDFNATRPHELERRQNLLESLLAEIGSGCYIEPPLHANWGKHTHFGKNVYANFNLTLVDDTDIYVGDNVMFGPNVTVATAGHPIEPSLRKQALQFNVPVHIGNNVWIGAGCILLPGVSIGDNSVIGAGSIVTKDIPADVVAVGNPCRVLRPISQRDRMYYYKDRKIDPTLIKGNDE